MHLIHKYITLILHLIICLGDTPIVNYSNLKTQIYKNDVFSPRPWSIWRKQGDFEIMGRLPYHGLKFYVTRVSLYNEDKYIIY